MANAETKEMVLANPCLRPSKDQPNDAYVVKNTCHSLNPDAFAPELMGDVTNVSNRMRQCM